MLKCIMCHFAFAVDIISAIEFDKTGDYLATGDRGGRVVIFERTDNREVSDYLCACLCFIYLHSNLLLYPVCYTFSFLTYVDKM